MKIPLSKIIIPIFAFILLSCNNDDSEELISDSVYIIGYEPCTINADYQIGYLMVSENLQDTLYTHSLSDITHKIPASVLSEKNEVLYEIPADYFQNYSNSIYLPESARFEFRLDIEYRYASEEEMISILCNELLPSFVATQVIVETASK